jgi:hypothetical protein
MFIDYRRPLHTYTTAFHAVRALHFFKLRLHKPRRRRRNGWRWLWPRMTRCGIAELCGDQQASPQLINQLSAARDIHGWSVLSPATAFSDCPSHPTAPDAAVTATATRLTTGRRNFVVTARSQVLVKPPAWQRVCAASCCVVLATRRPRFLAPGAGTRASLGRYPLQVRRHDGLLPAT